MKDVLMVSSPTRQGFFFTSDFYLSITESLHRACIHEHCTAFGIRQHSGITFIRLFSSKKSFQLILWKYGVTKKGKEWLSGVLSHLGSASVAFGLSHTFPRPSLTIANSICHTLNCDGGTELRLSAGLFLLLSRDCAYGYTKWIFGFLACLLLLLSFDLHTAVPFFSN
jgi:hypothetical protein